MGIKISMLIPFPEAIDDLPNSPIEQLAEWINWLTDNSIKFQIIIGVEIQCNEFPPGWTKKQNCISILDEKDAIAFKLKWL